MFQAVDHELTRQRRHWRIRKRIVGTAAKPRLSVHRSHQHLYLQLVDDMNHRTLSAFSTRQKEFRKVFSKGGNVEAAKKLGELACAYFKSQGHERLIFDRGGYLYHGRVRAIAEALRAGGMKF